MNWTEEIPCLSIEAQSNGNLRLEDKSYGDGAIIDLHPCQVRLMAERLGLIPGAVTESDGPRKTSCDGGSLYQELERLANWLEVIEVRSAQLYDNIMACALRAHEDLNIEVAQASALADIAEQLLKDARATLRRAATLGMQAPDSGAEAAPVASSAASKGVTTSVETPAPMAQGELL
ncbi:hypothetical protein [Hydrogenophaga sp. T2]|uniref:hypothetical protein n=1 Tax=Hydrogenophaga sp. T2 TaxID=3132823 RepID=UPI003CEA5074